MIKSGTAALNQKRAKAGSGVSFLRIPRNSKIDVVMLARADSEHIIGFHKHQVWGGGSGGPVVSHICLAERDENSKVIDDNDCPGCEQELPTTQRWLMPVLVDDGVKVWDFGVEVKDYLQNFWEDKVESGEEDDFPGMVVKVNRDDTGSRTKYTAYPSGRADVSHVNGDLPELDAFVGPHTRSEIIEHYEEKGWQYDKGDDWQSV